MSLFFIIIFETSYSMTWSHLWKFQDERYKNYYLVTKIVEGKTELSYCLRIGHNYKHLYNTELIKFNIESAFKIWLSSLTNYEIDVFNSIGEKIKLNKIKLVYKNECPILGSYEFDLNKKNEYDLEVYIDKIYKNKKKDIDEDQSHQIDSSIFISNIHTDFLSELLINNQNVDITTLKKEFLKLLNEHKNNPNSLLDESLRV